MMGPCTHPTGRHDWVTLGPVDGYGERLLACTGCDQVITPRRVAAEVVPVFRRLFDKACPPLDDAGLDLRDEALRVWSMLVELAGVSR